jgi:integrase/recombinase XerD
MATQIFAAGASQRLDGRFLGERPAIPLDVDDPATDAMNNVLSRYERKPHGPAKILDMAQVPAVLEWTAANTRVPEPAVLKVALSVYEGLRCCEIAGLTWADVTDANGAISPVIRVRESKYRKYREVPMHPCVRWLLGPFRQRFPDAERLAICKANGKPQNRNALKVWFGVLYRRMGLECSSHSGRRSLITFLANNHGRLGMSLLDVARIAGHEDVGTTQAYIQPSEQLHRLIESVPWLPPRGATMQGNPSVPLSVAGFGASRATGLPPFAMALFPTGALDQPSTPPLWVDDPLRTFASGAWDFGRQP